LRITFLENELSTIMLMYHDDSCGELLNNQGMCPKCGFHPDMQSTGFTDLPMEEYNRLKAQGLSFLGRFRTPA
jgi:hypothetical protein